MAATGCRTAAVTRRNWAEDFIYFQHTGDSTDPSRHRHCPGRWRGVISGGFGPDGKRIRRYVSSPTQAAVTDKLRQLHADVTAGSMPAPSSHTVRAAADPGCDRHHPA
jgi:hypothetical protein